MITVPTFAEFGRVASSDWSVGPRVAAEAIEFAAKQMNSAAKTSA